MEDFSQSRGDDDLFEDEIIPFEEAPPSTNQVAVQLEQVSLDRALSPAEQPPPPARPSVNVQTNHKTSTFPGFRPKPTGRGSHGATRGSSERKGGLSESRWATKPEKPQPAAVTSTPAVEETLSRENTQPEKSLEQADTAETPTPTDQAESPTGVPNAPTGPANAAASARPPAVRGDRTATGGVRKAKLTEEELNAKLAAAKERSQSVAAAHARAEADAASFQERERIAQKKREKDRVERKVMDNEREKNRQRKMAVMGGREWDSHKNEEDFRPVQNGRGGGRKFQSGVTSDQQYQAEQEDLKQYEWHDDRGRGRGKGRGRGGRGRGRGGFRHDGDGHTQQPDVSAETDFPALPAATKQAAETSNLNQSKWASTPLSAGGDGDGGGSWAEQVESSEAAANKN
ncbi:hypothetical protein EDD37DRAFT_381648 [Exophiala viscosa]|uniref:uncharacterized protein n=1 Tax=Exophiala viscosa TaxID=2486360 RepID=UPI0021935E26|nr:hypothetical protein EDD37DRAFT_381648 [Exophiala viscosa]